MVSVKWYVSFVCFATASVIADGFEFLVTSGHQVPIAESHDLLVSPCPSIFTYETNGVYWYGIIKAASQQFSDEIKLLVKLDYGALSPTRYRGNIELLEKKDVIENILNGKPITYKVNFPLLHQLPKIVLIQLNGDPICSGELSAGFAESKGVVDIEHVLKIEEDKNEHSDECLCEYDYAMKPKTSTQPSTTFKPQISTKKVPQYEPTTNGKTTPITTTIKTTTEADDGFIPDDSVNLLTMNQMVSQRSSQDDHETDQWSKLSRLLLNLRGYSSYEQEDKYPETQYTSLPKSFNDDHTRTRAMKRQKRQNGFEQHKARIDAIRGYSDGFFSKFNTENSNFDDSPFKSDIRQQFSSNEPFIKFTSSNSNIDDSPFQSDIRQQFSSFPSWANTDISNNGNPTQTRSENTYKYTVTKYKKVDQNDGSPPIISGGTWTNYDRTNSDGNRVSSNFQNTNYDELITDPSLDIFPPSSSLNNVIRQNESSSSSFNSQPTARPNKPSPSLNNGVSQKESPSSSFNSQPTVRPNTPRPFSKQSFTSGHQECGTTKATPLFKHGEETDKGDWPWLVAMFIKKDGSDLEFRCAGTLVSDRHIVTAAHCVRSRTNRPLDRSDMIIGVGVFNIQAWSADPDAHLHDVMRIEQHPEYSGNMRYLDDIALLILNQRVQYSNYIIPACIWEFDNDLSLLVGKNGTVVGWGRDENGLIVTPEPREGKVPIVSTNTCKNSNRKFHQLTSDTTLCAGARNGVGPCNGDSGGGMYIPMNNKWYLRGIVSISLPTVDRSCNLEQFVVYTDTSKYRNWLQNIMSEYP